MIRLEKLTKIFKTPNGNVTAADNIDMHVKAGEICVLLGASGCGKTTTLKMVNRLVTPSSGKIYIDGKDVTQMDVVALRRNIGYVIQQIGLFPNMTVEENITLVPRLLKWDKAKCRKRANELLELVALDPAVFLKRYPKELSGGQQQRVGVARALAADPPVMLMDEPFGAIDPINRKSIQDEFLQLQEKIKKTILLVSHDIDEALRMADKIAIFDHGKLVQFDTPEALLARPANSFVRNFLGGESALKRMALIRVEEVMQPRQKDGGGSEKTASFAGVAATSTLAEVAELIFSRNETTFPCVNADGMVVGQINLADINRYLLGGPERGRPC